MTPGDRSGSVATAAVAVAVALALLLAAGTAAGAPTVGDSADADGDLVAGSLPTIANDTDDATADDSITGTGDGSESDSENDSESDSTLVNGSDDGTAVDDGGTNASDDGETSVDGGASSVDADGNVSAGTDGTDLDSSVSLEAGNRTVLDANLSTTADGDGIDVDLDASSDAGVSVGANATAGSDGDQSDGGDGENRSAGTTGDGTGADGGDASEGGDQDGMSGPEQAGAGLAIGSVLVGGGLLARRFGEAATLAGGSGGSGGGTSVLSAAITWLRAWGWRLLALAGYQRLDSSDPLEHETRAAVYEAIRHEPGVFLAELQERTDVPMSTLRYHLRILEFEDLIDSEKVRGKRRYVQREAEPDALVPALDDEATAAVLEAVAREPDSVSGLADRLGRDPSTVTHHLQRLDDEGLVERERDGRSVVTRLADGIDRTEVAAAASAGHAD